MKRIEAIIAPDNVSDLCSALEEVGHHGVTVSAVEGRGYGRGWVHHVRNRSYNDIARERSRVEVVVKDEDVDRIIRAVSAAAAAGSSEDGEILVHDLAEVIRIRTSERGVAAL